MAIGKSTGARSRRGSHSRSRGRTRYLQPITCYRKAIALSNLERSFHCSGLQSFLNYLEIKKEVKMQTIRKIRSFCHKSFAQSIANIKMVKIKYWWLILLSALLHRLPFALFPPEAFVDVKRICMITSYVLLLWVLSRNFNFRSVRIMTLGSLLNFIAIIVNGGLMPVSPEARQLAQMMPLDQSQFGMVLPEGSGVLLPIDQTNLWFFTDIIPASHFAGVYSIGDILLIIGFLIFLMEIIFNKHIIVQSVSSSTSSNKMAETRKQIDEVMAR